MAYEQTKVFENGVAVRADRGHRAGAGVVARDLRGGRRGHGGQGGRQERVILFNLSGHGLLDLGAYDAYLGGKLENYDHPEEAIAESIAEAPKVD